MKKHFLFFVPGLLGTELWDDTTLPTKVWGSDILSFWRTLGKKSSPNPLVRKLRPGKIIREFTLFGVNIRPAYGRFLDHLKTLGYDEKNFASFGYDWRGDIEFAADQFAQAIRDRVEQGKVPIKIVCHSLGGLVVRCALNKHHNLIPHIGSFVQIGVPALGSPEAYHVFRETPRAGSAFGLDFILKLLFLFSSKRLDVLHEVLRTFDAVFQLLPPEGQKPLIAPDGKSHSALVPRFWREEHVHEKLVRAEAVHKLTDGCGYPDALAYYGAGMDTHLMYKVDYIGTIQTVEVWGAGDGTVPAFSATNNCAREKHIDGRIAHHQLPNNRALLEFLTQELA